MRGPNTPTAGQALQLAPSGPNSIPDLSEQVQSLTSDSDIDKSAFYRGWAWLVLVDTRLNPAPAGRVAKIQPLVKSCILVGSHADSCDVVLASGRISREHAEIEFDFAQGQFSLVDRNSTNGTYVRPPGGNETRVITRQMLVDSCQIRFADDAVFVFRCFAQKAAKSGRVS